MNYYRVHDVNQPFILIDAGVYTLVDIRQLNSKYQFFFYIPSQEAKDKYL